MSTKINENLINQSIFKHSIISITDVDGNIIEANDNFYAMTGWSKEEVIGKTHHLMSSSHHKSDFWSSLWKTIKSGHVWRGDIKNIKKNGDECWFDAHIIPFFDAGKVSAFISIWNDITEIKSQQELLVASKDRVINDSSIKSDFIGVAGDVMETSMDGISKMISILSKSDIDAPLKNIVESAKSCSDNMSSAINEMKYFSSITSGNLSVDVKQVHPIVLVKSAFALHTERVIKKDLQYSISISRNDFPNADINIDANKARQIISAMIEHAILVTKKGKISIDISLNRRSGIKSELVVAVLDTGPGISESMFKTMFDPSSKENHTKNNLIGFGLPLAKKFAKLIGGSIRADNTMNGSVLVFSVDVDIVHRSERTQGQKNIMMVGADQSTDNLFIKLQKAGFNVLKVDSGKPAIKSLMEIISNEGSVDMIVVDASMSDISPVDFISSVRKVDDLTETPMVLVGYMDFNYKNKALLSGYLSCIDHAIDADLLVDISKTTLTNDKPSNYECQPLVGKGGHGKASVLIVANDEFAKIISSNLAKGQCNIHVVDNADEMLEISSSVNFSVIIADVGIDGVKHATQRMVLRGAMLSLSVPIIAACKELTPEIWESSMSFGFIDVIDVSNEFSIWDSVSKWILEESELSSGSNLISDDEGTILIADGDASTLKMLRKYMEESSYRVIEAHNGSEVISMQKELNPDLIIMDSDLPLVSGFEACNTIKSSIDGVNCPVVIITDRNDEISANRAMDAGAIDFIQKPIFLPVLKQRVKSIVVSKTAQRHIEHLAYHDRLTNLPNRIMFDEKIDVALKIAHREKTKVAVMFMDLDRFKNVNDSLGHQAGDKLLQQAADRMKRMIRPGDTLARMGGDEFTVLLQDIDETDSDVNAARRVAERIIRVMNERFDIDGNSVHVGVSIGIAVSGSDGNDSETLLKNADTALYASKDAGRNKFTFFSAAMNVMVEEKIKLEDGLRKAIHKNEIVAYYQPQVDVQTGRIIGMEALARWKRPDGSLISPAKFIPVAEESGMIVKIGEQIMTEACQTVVNHLRDGLLDNDFKISVNLSPVQFMSPGLTETVKKVIKETGIPAHMLHLEITESLAMKNVEMVQNVIKEIKEFGVGVAMDDFGTGFCSLSYLKMFPIDTLKIDQSFMRGVTEENAEKGDAAIVRAIISMSKAMGITVVAEGVETEEQINFLKETGADAAQGYLLHKPDTFDVIKKWMLSRHH